MSEHPAGPRASPAVALGWPGQGGKSGGVDRVAPDRAAGQRPCSATKAGRSTP